jgi:alpha-1,4-digalacturonate transport system substrate-binding protein
MLINKDIFKKAGVSYPKSPKDIWTWKEFLKKTDKLRKYCDYPGLIDQSVFRWSTLLYEYGGSIWDKTGTTLEIDSKAGIEAMKTFAYMQKNLVINPNVWIEISSRDPKKLFRTGKYAFYIGGSWLLEGYEDLPFDWGVTYLPIGTRRSSVLGCKFFMAIANSGYEKEAKEFLKFMSDKKVSDNYCEDTIALSPRIDSKDIDYPHCREMISIFNNELANTPDLTVSDWSHKHAPIISYYIHKAIHAVIDGTPPKKALNNLNENISILQKNNFKYPFSSTINSK